MAKSQRDKGARVEREITKMLQDNGIDALKVPLSGACEGYKGDIAIRAGDDVLHCEVKARKNGAGFTTLENWLGDNDFLFLKRNNRDPMVVMDWAVFIAICKHGIMEGAND